MKVNIPTLNIDSSWPEPFIAKNKDCINLVIAINLHQMYMNGK